MTGIPQRCGEDVRPGEGSRDAALREWRAGRPLATGPSGLEPEPKAPRNAWREDARRTLGLSTGIAGIAACTTYQVTSGVAECLSPGPHPLLL
ncbi:hypothetical protein [Erwinia sp. ErVv1]|uniref:hypothetical protein n=1 Tax=Erwinia sp. ErVv1 TaxID=1603299 RepID=UPI0012E87EDF|nr:hypothetical protein [Erwinia sp. ErVv1]